MLYDLPLLVVTNIVALATLLIVVVAHTVRVSLRFMLIVTILSMMLWQDMIFIANHATEHLLLLNNLLFLWPTLAVAGFYGFLHFFDVQRVAKKHDHSIKRLLTAGLSLGIVLQLAALATAQIFDRVTLMDDGSYDFSRGYGYYLYIIGLDVALLCLVVRLLVNVTTARKHSHERHALVAVLYTTTIASVYGLIMNVIIPLVANSQQFIGLGMLTVDIFAIGFTVSIMRGRLLDIKLYAVRSVVYLLSLASLVAIYVLIAVVMARWFFEPAVSSPVYMAFNIVAALLLAFLFQPIKRFFDHVTNSLFYRDNYETSEFYARLSRVLATTTDLRGLLSRAAAEITSTLKAEYGLFFVYDDERHMLVETHGDHARLLVRDARVIGEAIERHGAGVVATDLLDNEELHRLLVSRGIRLALPLQRGEGHLIGYFLMGDHRSSTYTLRDIRALETIADELAIAIQNAFSIQEVKELNGTLQERVDDATKELRASNNKLQRLDQAKDEFVSMASHQLRTPLTSVKGYISMVLEGDAGEITPMQQKLLGEAFASSERMVHLINDFLNVSRLQTGKFMIDAKATNLAKVVGQEVDALESTAKSRGLTLRYRAPSHMPVLYVDEGKLRQVIMNFLDNAIYYSRERTVITVKLSVEAGEVLFEVHDTGIGVPEAEQAHLFSKFFRATNARKQRPDGTGVGLYLAKKVITAHGGSIVFSSVEGEGSVFGFRLPVKKLLEAPASDTDELEHEPGKA